MTRSVYAEAVEREFDEWSENDTIASVIDRGISLYDRYGDDALGDFFAMFADLAAERSNTQADERKTP